MSLYRAASRPEMSTALPSTSSSMKRSGSLRFDTGRIRRNIQKQFSRTREKMRGEKAERNDDDYLKKCELVVTKKQASTVKLQTELKRHLKALKNVTASSRSLYETILEAYEDNWSGRKQFSEAFLGFDSYWPTYHNNMCTVMEQVTTKLAEFVALKDKLEKRKRKAMDFNIVERNLKEAMSTKRRDPSKLQKAEREVEIMRRAYAEVHSEVSRDLPRFYDDHVHFCCENWAFLLENEKHMYDHLCSTVTTFLDSVDQLRIGYQKKLYQLEGVDVSYSEISRSTLSLHYPSHSSPYSDLYEPLGPRGRAESGPAFQGRSRGSSSVSRQSSSVSSRAAGSVPPNENIFDLNFELAEPLLGGGCRSVELVADGANVAVTAANREDYVRRYVAYTFHGSCGHQFEALKKGFYQVCGEYLGRLFRPTELQNVVQGSEEYEWDLLRDNATYSGVLCQHHDLVKWFWAVFFEDMTDEKKKQLLLFVTGSDRVPVVGMSGIRLEISNSVRTNDFHFPIAHTCYSFLELPLYSSKSVLKRQILTAIEHSEGFGIE